MTQPWSISLKLYSASCVRLCGGVALLLSLLLLGCSDARKQSSAREGHLDLSSDRQLLEDSAGDLDGVWLFRWQEFIEPSAFQTGAPAGMFSIQLPSIWNGKFSEGEEMGLSGEGYATYALELKLPDAPSNDQWALLVHEVSTAYALYAVTSNEVRLIAKNGRVGKNGSEHIAQWSRRVAPLPESSDGKMWLVMHLSNFSYVRGGAWKSIQIGTAGRLDRALTVRNLLSAGLLGILLVMALYHLARYLMRRTDLGSAWFTLLCVLVSVREFTISRMADYVAYVPTDTIFNILIRLEFLSFQMAGPAVMGFVGVVFPSSRYRSLTRLAWWLSAPYLFISIFMSTQAMSMVLKSYYVIMAGQILTTLIYLGYCVLRRRNYAWVGLFGCVVLALGATHDMFFAHGFQGSGYWTTYCFGIFVLVESYLLAAQSTLAFKQVEKSRQDNLEKIKAQVESSRLERELSGALKTKIHIFSNVAHELNNPLNYVSLGADGSSQHLESLKKVLDRLLEGAPDTPEGQKVVADIEAQFDDIRKNLDIVSSGSNVAANVIDEMRGLAEVDGKIREELRVGALLDGAMRRVRADQRPEVFEQVHFNESLGNLEQAVEGNPYMLIHAISHVLINAVRYSVLAAEAPTVWLSTRLTQEAWVLAIQNNGPPIEATAMKALLEPGDRGETGRNLPVAHALLKEQGARLRLCDTGQITGRVLFEIELPLVGQQRPTEAFEAS